MKFSCAISEGSDIPVQICSLARTFAACALSMDIQPEIRHVAH